MTTKAQLKDYYARVERGDDDSVTITIRTNRVSHHHPGNFEGAALGLATIGLSLLIDTDEARTELEAIARERREAKAE